LVAGFFLEVIALCLIASFTLISIESTTMAGTCNAVSNTH